jgi:hypothetical protein
VVRAVEYPTIQRNQTVASGVLRGILVLAAVALGDRRSIIPQILEPMARHPPRAMAPQAEAAEARVQIKAGLVGLVDSREAAAAVAGPVMSGRAA